MFPLSRTVILSWRFFRHLKRGSRYRVLNVQFEVQSSRPIVEGETLICYFDARGKGWARPADEFNDGRFERITDE